MNVFLKSKSWRETENTQHIRPALASRICVELEHPKKPTQDIDFDGLAKEFRALYEPVCAALMQLLVELGGKLEPSERQASIIDE